jgi:hypothetical protein
MLASSSSKKKSRTPGGREHIRVGTQGKDHSLPSSHSLTTFQGIERTLEEVELTLSDFPSVSSYPGTKIYIPLIAFQPDNKAKSKAKPPKAETKFAKVSSCLRIHHLSSHLAGRCKDDICTSSFTEAPEQYWHLQFRKPIVLVIPRIQIVE